MLNTFKTKIAAGATIIGLGGLAGVALSSGPGHKPAQAPVATKPEIRTKTIRRTIHVTRHVKPKHPIGAARPAAATGATYSAAAGAPSTGASSTGSAPAAVPVSTSTSGSSPAPSVAPTPVSTSTSGASAPSSQPSTPVTTATSGGGAAGGAGGGASGGEGESEGERGGDG